MSFRTRRVLFSTPLYMLFEFFLMKYLFLLFGGIDDLYTLLFTLIFGVLNVVPMLFEEKKSRFITRLMDKISGLWIWVSLFILIDLIILYTAGLFIQIPETVKIISLILIFLLGVYNFYKAHKLVINKKTIELDNLDEEINIVHLSDVHFGAIRHGEVIRKLKNKLKELENTCDLAIIAGDLADGSCIVEEDDFKELKDVNIPIIFTPGNHDFYPGIENVYKACTNADIKILNNSGIKFKGVNIFGLTYSFGDIETVSFSELKSFINEDEVNIIIYHVPQNWEEFSKLGFDIQLSGHTHGGQFQPIVWIANRLMYNMGLFKGQINGKDKYLHVTTGVGVMDYPMRWGTDSELVILKLKPKN